MAELRDYESSDISVRGTLIAVLIGSLTVTIIAAALLLLTLQLGEEGAIPSPGSMPGVAREPGAPPLQVDPSADLRRLEAAARARLEAAGWVDRRRGLAHIPIGRAMEMLAERGWPEGAP